MCLPSSFGNWFCHWSPCFVKPEDCFWREVKKSTTRWLLRARAPVYLLNNSHVLIQRVGGGSAVSGGMMGAWGGVGVERPILFLLPAPCVAVNRVCYCSDWGEITALENPAFNLPFWAVFLPLSPQRHHGNGPHHLPPICPEWAHPTSRAVIGRGGCRACGQPGVISTRKLWRKPKPPPKTRIMVECSLSLIANLRGQKRFEDHNLKCLDSTRGSFWAPFHKRARCNASEFRCIYLPLHPVTSKSSGRASGARVCARVFWSTVDSFKVQVRAEIETSCVLFSWNIPPFVSNPFNVSAAFVPFFFSVYFFFSSFFAVNPRPAALWEEATLWVTLWPASLPHITHPS